MKIKRFQAEDMTSAIKQVREAFGPDAVILSNQTKGNGVEVVAAMNYDENAVEQSDASWIEDPILAQMKEEIHSLRDMMQHQLAGFAWNKRQHCTPTQITLIKQLTNAGFHPELSEIIAAKSPDCNSIESAWDKAIELLINSLQVTEPDIVNNGGVFALLGPTGVGKTTTIAKLAARFVLQHGPSDIALISTDTYRIAAHQQLSTYAKILGINVAIAEDADSLQKAISRYATKKLILIDTAGMSQRDSGLSAQLEMLNNNSRRIHCSLVLSTASQRLVLEETVRAFSQHQIDNCILTKVDETSNLSSVLSTMIRYKLPIGYYTAGQRVPEDITVAHAGNLIELAINNAKKYYQPLQEEVLAQAVAGNLAYATD